MKIKKIELKNFKFHTELEFEINKKNCLIYGENGTGKSSIYEALNAIFTIYFRDRSFSINKFKNHISEEALSAKVIFEDTSEFLIPQKNIPLREGKETIYFANQDLLESIILNRNFYDTIKYSFQNTFFSLYDFHTNFKLINSMIDSSNYLEVEENRQKNIYNIINFLEKIKLKTNDILNNSFQEEFTINFEYTWGLSNTVDDFKYPNPKIILKIDDKKNLKLNFNEAKLKLTSIAIFFALIKLEEGENNTNPLKLLVLDDFLTSLDTANRHYIIEYILENFRDYQKIILTHNLQFYNLIVKLLNRKNENTNWDTKHIFLIKDNHQEIAIVSPRSHDYIEDAKSELIRGQYRKSGNALRKEFERINNEFKELLELGKSEKLQGIIDTLKSNAIIFSEKPHQLLNEINPYIYNFKGILNSHNIEIEKKIEKLKELIEKIIKAIEDNKCDLSEVKELLNKTEFYRDILFNPASHNNEEIEIYRKECINSIKLLEDLNKILNNLQGKIK